MKVEIWLDRLSQGIDLSGVVSTYQKGDLFCVKLQDGYVFKYPIDHLFCVKESGFELSHEEVM